MTHPRVILLFAALVLGGCGEDPRPLNRLADDAVILAFGDSLTRGTGGKNGESYPRALESLSGRRVINAGIPGELSTQGLNRIAAVLEKSGAALMILCHGGNDMLRKKSMATLEKNIRAMVEMARSQQIQVVLVGVPKPGLLLGTAQMYRDIADSMELTAELEIIAEVLGDASLKSDAAHPNATGYRRIAQALHELLSAAGAY
jgi:lysophospholipase L1-like esterase